MGTSRDCPGDPVAVSRSMMLLGVLLFPVGLLLLVLLPLLPSERSRVDW